MKIFRVTTLTAAVAATSLLLAGCSGGDEASEESSSAATTSASESAAVQLPSAQELNDVLTRAADQNLPIEERVKTVQGGEAAPELFDVMAGAQQANGGELIVVDPVLPGHRPTEALAVVEIRQPNVPPEKATDVLFVYEDGNWKLAINWACTLVSNVAPDQIPPACSAYVNPAPPADEPAPAPVGEPVPAPAGEPAAPAPGDPLAPAPGDQPAPAPAPAPMPAPAPAPIDQPAPAPAPAPAP